MGDNLTLEQRHSAMHAIGERACAWAAEQDSDVCSIVADEEHLPLALVKAAEFRLAGRPFLAVPLLDDLQTTYVRRRALLAIADGDLAQQQAALERLATESRNPAIIGVTPELHRTAAAVRVLYDFVIAADGVLVRSIFDMIRLRALLPAATLQKLTIVTGSSRISKKNQPAPPRRKPEGDLVLLWAPQFDGDLLGLEVFALATCGRPAAIIGRGKRLEGTSVEFGSLENAAEFLARSRVVIIADACDPAPAVAFAKLGFNVIASAASGASEQLDRIIEYDSTSLTALQEAIAHAWGATVTQVRGALDGCDGPRYIVPEDARIGASRQLAETAWYLGTSYDTRRDAFDRIATSVAGMPTHSTVDPNLLTPFLASGQSVCFQSVREVMRSRQNLGPHMPRFSLAHVEDTDVPKDLPAVRTRDAVVVWAPNQHAASLATIIMGLNYEKRDVIIVCAGGTLPGAKAIFVGPERGAQSLARAIACVDAETRTPAASVALARLGIPLAVASTSGADEFLDGVTVYDPWDHVSVAFAMAIAKASPGPIGRRQISALELAERLAIYSSDVLEEGPLVSVVLLTRDRRHFLTRALASVASQRYRNIETIVVRNGGVAVDDIVATTPGARVLNSETNLGVNGGLNFGTLAAAGKYIAYLADDDEYLPEHIGSAVAVLERTGGTFAHGGMLAVHLVPDGHGGYSANGYGIACERAAEPGAMRAMNSVATPAMLIDRELLAKTGNWDEALGSMADYEIAMRFMLLDELLYINRPTIVQTYRRDATQYSASKNSEMPLTLRALYDRHPLDDEPWVQQQRASWLASFEQHQKSKSVTPLWYPSPTVTFPPFPYSAAESSEVSDRDPAPTS